MATAVKAPTKSEVMTQLAEKTGLTKKEVAAVFESLAGLMKKELKKTGVFSLAGLCKIKVIHKKAQPAREGINPFTKEPTVFKAKPARKVVKALPLKALKDAVK